MGVLPGWWLGGADLRFPEPYMDSARWDTELRAAGFAGAEAVAHDGYLNNNIITTPAAPQPPPSKRVTLLHSGETTTTTTIAVIASLRAQLQLSGYQIDLHTLDTPSLPENQDILVALDLTEPFFHNLTPRRLASFQELVRQARDRGCGVLWLTGASQVGCVDPRFAPVVGVARVLRTETGLDFATLELDCLGQVDVEFGAVPAVLAEFQRRGPEEEDVRSEAEWACVGGRVLIGRYHFVDVAKGITTAGDGEGGPAEKTVLKLEQHRPGLVNTLFWERRAETALGENDVRVEVQAVGLNFKVNMASSFPPLYFFLSL